MKSEMEMIIFRYSATVQKPNPSPRTNPATQPFVTSPSIAPLHLFDDLPDSSSGGKDGKNDLFGDMPESSRKGENRGEKRKVEEEQAERETVKRKTTGNCL